MRGTDRSTMILCTCKLAKGIQERGAVLESLDSGSISKLGDACAVTWI